MTDLIDRFWDKIDVKVGACWNWTGSTHVNGYGCIAISNRTRKAHRVSYELHRGPIPKKLMVLHSCDNRLCVNPAHLSLGSHWDNMIDRDTKGRQARGAENGATKLSDEDVANIRAATGPWGLNTKLAKQYNVNQCQISRIRMGKRR